MFLLKESIILYFHQDYPEASKKTTPIAYSPLKGEDAIAFMRTFPEKVKLIMCNYSALLNFTAEHAENAKNKAFSYQWSAVGNLLKADD